MFLIKKILGPLSRREREAAEPEARFLHVGYLGSWALNKPQFKADLSSDQESTLSRWYQDHKRDPGIYCEMDAIKKLFPASLIPISHEEAVRFVALSHQDEVD